MVDQSDPAPMPEGQRSPFQHIDCDHSEFIDASFSIDERCSCSMYAVHCGRREMDIACCDPGDRRSLLPLRSYAILKISLSTKLGIVVDRLEQPSLQFP